MGRSPSFNVWIRNQLETVAKDNFLPEMGMEPGPDISPAISSHFTPAKLQEHERHTLPGLHHTSECVLPSYSDKQQQLHYWASLLPAGP